MDNSEGENTPLIDNSGSPSHSVRILLPPEVTVTNAAVKYELQGDVALIQFDDGKANVMTRNALAALGDALDRAEKESRCVIWTGRPGRFCAGFDLKVLAGRDQQAVDLLLEGAQLAIRLYSFPVPVVIGCSGHALGMGAIYLMTGDVRLGLQGEFKIGLPEVTMGMTMPAFGIELTEQRLAKAYLNRAVCCAEIFDPQGAAAAGFVDALASPEQFQQQLLATAQGLVALDRVAHHETKLAMRRESLQRLTASLDAIHL